MRSSGRMCIVVGRRESVQSIVAVRSIGKHVLVVITGATSGNNNLVAVRCFPCRRWADGWSSSRFNRPMPQLQSRRELIYFVWSATGTNERNDEETPGGLGSISSRQQTQQVPVRSQATWTRRRRAQHARCSPQRKTSLRTSWVLDCKKTQSMRVNIWILYSVLFCEDCISILDVK